MKDSKNLKTMIFMAMYCALAIVLDLVKQFIPFTSIWSNGGSIDIALIPLVFACIHLGFVKGTLTALLELLISYIIGTTTIYVAPKLPLLGVMCDYIIPMLVVGLTTVLIKKDDNDSKFIIKLEIGIFLMMAIRIMAQVISGVFCWLDSGTLSWAVWTSSFVYNLGYGIPTLIVLLIIMPLLYKSLKSFIKKGNL